MSGIKATKKISLDLGNMDSEQQRPSQHSKHDQQNERNGAAPTPPSLTPLPVPQEVYHVFLASPGDMNEERQLVRRFFEDFNQQIAQTLGVRFEVIDWENYSSVGIGRPQELITSQTLERYSNSLALVIGLMGQRFGFPTGEYESGTEEEFEWALASYREHGFPEIKWFFRCIREFKAPADSPTAIEEALEQWKKVQEFKRRLEKGQPNLFYKEFRDTAHFRDVLQQDLSTWLAAAERPWSVSSARQELERERRAIQLLTSDVPAPLPRIVHPYLLLKTSKGFVGRRDELNRLSDWILRPEDVNNARVFVIVSIGGNGKSALAWHWFNNVAPIDYTWAGRLWLSFYDEDTTYEQFITESLGYVTGQPVRRDWQANGGLDTLLADYEQQLLDVLHQRPFLITLDGFERLLNANRAGYQAAFLDDEFESETTARKLRQTSDVRFGWLLKKLATIEMSRILITSRLFPEALETPTDRAISGCYRYDLQGLSPNDAVELWRSFEVTGSRDRLLGLFRRFHNHPLLIQALANVVAHDRRTPRNFDGWLEGHHDSHLYRDLSLKQVTTHILDTVLATLTDDESLLLGYLAACRTPTKYETLLSLLVGPKRHFGHPDSLDLCLTHLENRGLVGWDQERNRYELHPIVRGVTWERTEKSRQGIIRDQLSDYFRKQPSVNWFDVRTVDDLSPSIELFNSQIELGEFDKAFETFEKGLREQVSWRLGLSEWLVELVERFFPDGADKPPRLTRVEAQREAAFTLGVARLISGRPQKASAVFQQLCQDCEDKEVLSGALCWLSDALRRCGSLYEAERAARRALMTSRELSHEYLEGTTLYRLGCTLTMRGKQDEGRAALDRSLRIWIKKADTQQEGLVSAYLAENWLLSGRADLAADLADRAWELAHEALFEADFIRGARVQGMVAAARGDPATAEERLHHALTRARAGGLVEEALPTLIALARVHMIRDDLERSQQLLDEVIDQALAGPYPTFYADALNVLAKLELKRLNHERAYKFAGKAFETAWFDGEPFSFAAGLAAARDLLDQLGQPVPEVKPFNQAHFEPLPEVMIDPAEKHVPGTS